MSGRVFLDVCWIFRLLLQLASVKWAWNVVKPIAPHSPIEVLDVSPILVLTERVNTEACALLLFGSIPRQAHLGLTPASTR